MDIPSDQDNLRWQSRGKRSKLSDPNSNEISAAEALILLALSNGGICITAPLGSTDSNVGSKEESKYSNSPDTPLLLGSRHVCKVCDEICKSHQALGGHMTKHRNKEVAATAATTTTTIAVRGRGYVCSSCQQEFSSGQALGGHKRKHLTAGGKKEVYSDGATSRVVARPEIDLNIPPPP